MRQRGFTLLEMMVVMVIIGTIMAIAIPRINDAFEVNLKSAMRRLQGAITFAFNESVIKQTPLRLNFDLTTGEYWITYLMVQGSTGEFKQVDSEFTRRQRMPDGVFFTDVVTPHDQEKRQEGEDIFIGFYPTGFAERAVIHLASHDGREYTLLIKPLTGKVTIYDGYIDFVELSPQFGSENSPFTSSGGMGL